MRKYGLGVPGSDDENKFHFLLPVPLIFFSPSAQFILELIFWEGKYRVTQDPFWKTDKSIH